MISPESVAFSSPPSSILKFPSTAFHVASRSHLSVKMPSIKHSGFRSTLPTAAKPKSAFGGSFESTLYHYPSASSAGAMSPTQAYALGYAKGHASSSGSWLDAVKHDAGGVLDKTLNVLSRANWGMARGFDYATKHGDVPNVSAFIHGFKQGAIDGKAETFGQIFQRRKTFGNNTYVNHGLGLVTDVITDPTTYLGGAGLYKDAARFGLHAGLDALETQGAAKLLGKEIAPLAADASPEMKAAHEAQTVLNNRLAETEFKNARAKYAGIRFGPSRKLSVTLRTPLRISKAKDAKLAAMENAGPLASLKHSLGKAFVPGYENPVGHVIENHVGHMVERNSDAMMHGLLQTMKGSTKGFNSTGDQFKALLAGVVPGAVKHGVMNHDLVVNELRKLGFQGDKLTAAHGFLQAFHQAGRQLLERDRAFGMDYKDVGAGSKGIMYVPHVFEKKHLVPNIAHAKSLVGHQGFENAKKLTLQQAMELHKTGADRHLVTDPIEMLARRVHKGAVGQATAAMRNYIRTNHAIPDKILGNPEHLAKVFAKTARLHGDAQALKAQIAEHGSLETAQKTLKAAHVQQVRKLNKSLKGLSQQALADRAGTYREFAAEAKKNQLTQAAIRALPKIEKRVHTKQEALSLARLTRSHSSLLKQMMEHESLDAMRARHAQELTDLGMKHAKATHELQTSLDRTMKDLEQAHGAALKKAFVKNPQLAAHLRPLDQLKTRKDLGQLKAEVGNTADYKAKMLEAASLKETKKGMTVSYHVPHEIHASVNRIETVLNDPSSMHGLEKAFQKAISKWKLYVTMGNPGYGMRNTMSDLWNAYVRGMPTWAFPVYAAKAAKLMRAAHNGDQKAIDVLDRAAYHGILTGFYNTDIREALKGGAQVSKLAHPMRSATRGLVTANIARENLGRMTHYLYRMDREGMTPAAAANEVRIAHFDYTDLTPFEQQRMKSIAPFYTWTRKNVPLQLQQLVAAPGKMASYEKAANESEQATGIKPGELASTVFQSHPMAFKTPLGYFDPNVGLSDLARVANPTQLMQMVNPAIQLPLEKGFNLDFFTGQPIQGAHATHQLTPAPGLVASILSHIPGASALDLTAGETGRAMGKNGAEIHGPGISNFAAMLLDQVPLGSEIMSRNFTQSSKSKPFFNVLGQPIGARDLGYATGLSFTRPNQQEEQAILQLNEQAAEQAALKKLREAGQFPAAKRAKPSAFQKEINAILKRHAQRG